MFSFSATKIYLKEFCFEMFPQWRKNDLNLTRDWLFMVTKPKNERMYNLCCFAVLLVAVWCLWRLLSVSCCVWLGMVWKVVFCGFYIFTYNTSISTYTKWNYFFLLNVWIKLQFHMQWFSIRIERSNQTMNVELFRFNLSMHGEGFNTKLNFINLK